MEQIEDENFKKIRDQAEDIYHDIDSVYCPYFADNVSFNSKGLEHIKFKSKRKKRCFCQIKKYSFSS